MDKLTILIPYLVNRDRDSFGYLIDEIGNQRPEMNILSFGDHGEKTTGYKRNALLKAAKSEYVWFVDADDMILPGSLNAILEALESNPDCLAINGYMTTNGKDKKDFFIAKDNPYKSEIRNGKEIYLRWTNHITPIRTKIAQKIKFPDKTFKEDYEWSVKLRESGLLETESIVDIPVYHYQFKTNK